MKADRFTLATDRRERRIDFTQFLWSSDPTSWAGFGLELHRVGPSGVLKDFGVPDILLGLCVGGSAEMSWELDTKRRARVATGQFILLDHGERQPSISWSGTRETLYVRLAHAQLQQLLPDTDDTSASVEPQFAAVDPPVQRLVRCLYDEARAGAPAGAAYAQALSLALAQRLLARYARRPGSVQRRRDAFTPARMARIRDYVQANLGRDASLLELSRVAGLSPHYFLHLFKQAFGVTPHRYLLAQRIEQAKRLLKDGALSLPEIALSLGFADQSHFTATFRRIAGTTPMRFRRDG